MMSMLVIMVAQDNRNGPVKQNYEASETAANERT